MFTPIPFSRSESSAPVAAIVRTVPEQHVTWNRPVFKAPPLVVKPPVADVADFTAMNAKRVRA
jgi:hypothetical protein